MWGSLTVEPGIGYVKTYPLEQFYWQNNLEVAAAPLHNTPRLKGVLFSVSHT